MLPTLRQFLDDPRGRNGYVDEPGFLNLYVRKGRRCVNGVLHEQVIDLAFLVAKHPGKGLLGRLVRRLAKAYPEHGLFVESVLNKRLPRRLVELGFEPAKDTNPPCFWMPPRKKQRTRRRSEDEQ
jgi:hypothetical protein